MVDYFAWTDALSARPASGAELPVPAVVTSAGERARTADHQHAESTAPRAPLVTSARS